MSVLFSVYLTRQLLLYFHLCLYELCMNWEQNKETNIKQTDIQVEKQTLIKTKPTIFYTITIKLFTVTSV